MDDSLIEFAEDGAKFLAGLIRAGEGFDRDSPRHWKSSAWDAVLETYLDKFDPKQARIYREARAAFFKTISADEN